MRAEVYVERWPLYVQRAKRQLAQYGNKAQVRDVVFQATTIICAELFDEVQKEVSCLVTDDNLLLTDEGKKAIYDRERKWQNIRRGVVKKHAKGATLPEGAFMQYVSMMLSK
jgi:hypothetical protein